MPTQLSFEHFYRYSDDINGIVLPTALRWSGKLVQTFASVDSGAAYCVFSREIGDELGSDIESGIPKRMGGITGTLDTFGHEITIQTLEVAVESVVYFARHPGVQRNLLGRTGWLRKLRVAISDYDGLLYYEKRV